MLSRVAHNLYWLARYVERAENVARMIEVTSNLNVDRKFDQSEQWQPLIMITGDQDMYAEHHDKFTQDDVLQFLAFDESYPNSIVSCLAYARENARTVREVISNEMWEHLNGLYMMAKSGEFDVDDPSLFFEKIKIGAITFGGLSATTMSRGLAWNWMRMGTMLERADKTSRILDVKYFLLLPAASYVGTNYDHVQWRALLQSASALQMYRQIHHQITPKLVAEFMLLDQHFPRSLTYCLAKANASLHSVTGTPLGRYSNDSEKMLGRALAELTYADIDEVIKTGLHEFIDQQQVVMNNIDQMLYNQYFSLTATSS